MFKEVSRAEKDRQNEYSRNRYRSDAIFKEKQKVKNKVYYERTKELEGRCHGLTGTGAWKAWHSMRSRVLCESAVGHEQYKNRAIDKRWNLFVNFYDDMGDRPEGMSLDRIDNSKGYFKENCRWATAKQQTRNKPGTNKLDIAKAREIKKLIGLIPYSEIASLYDVHIATISDIKHGRTWQEEVANV